MRLVCQANKKANRICSKANGDHPKCRYGLRWNGARRRGRSRIALRPCEFLSQCPIHIQQPFHLPCRIGDDNRVWRQARSVVFHIAATRVCYPSGLLPICALTGHAPPTSIKNNLTKKREMQIRKRLDLTDANLDRRLRLKLVNLFCSSYLQLVQNSRSGGAHRPDGSANRARLY
jgi:hypothetical protein